MRCVTRRKENKWAPHPCIQIAEEISDQQHMWHCILGWALCLTLPNCNRFPRHSDRSIISDRRGRHSILSRHPISRTITSPLSADEGSELREVQRGLKSGSGVSSRWRRTSNGWLLRLCSAQAQLVTLPDYCACQWYVGRLLRDMST